MSEAELIEAYVSSSEIAIATLTFYLTIVTGYLVVAHLAGATLLRRQVVLVNAIFVVFALFALWGTVAYFRIASYFWAQTAILTKRFAPRIWGVPTLWWGGSSY